MDRTLMPTPSPTQRVLLIGYRGTGKTSVAACLSKISGERWIDTDTEIIRVADCAISEIFNREGEDGFRRRETFALREILDQPYPIIACGGGIVLLEENRRLLADAGTCVWLRASVDTIQHRLECDPESATQRPPLTNLGQLDEIRQILKERESLYTQCADLAIETDKKQANQIAAEIMTHATIHPPDID